MALRKLKTKAIQPLTAKSASVSQKTSPNRPNSSFNIQQSIEKLENLDFLIQSKGTPKVSYSFAKEIQALEKNLDCSEINSMGATFSSQQVFNVYFSFLENLAKIIQCRDLKLFNLLNRGVKGCEKAFKRVFHEFHSMVNEKETGRILEPLKKSSAVQTEILENIEEKSFLTSDYENFKDLPKAFEKIKLSRVSSQLSEIYEELKTLLTDIPNETSILGIKAPHSYQPLKSEEAKKIIMTELQEIKENIEIFIKKKRLRALQINKEIQTDKEAKNPTWLALEALNEEKELVLLRLRGKLEITISEKNKLEERLIQSNNRCSDLEDKATLLERDCLSLRHMNEGLSLNLKTSEKRILELGAMLKKLISFSEFHKNFKETLQGLETKKRVSENKNLAKEKTRRPSGYLRAAESGTDKGPKLLNSDLKEDDSLKSFREKLVIEIEKIENSENGIQEKNEGTPGRFDKFLETKSNFVKNKEGKYVKAEIAKMNSVEVKRNKKTTQECSTSSDPIQLLDSETFSNRLASLLQETNSEVLPDLSEKQMKNLLGEDIVRLLKNDGKEESFSELLENPSNSLQTTKNSFKPSDLQVLMNSEKPAVKPDKQAFSSSEESDSEASSVSESESDSSSFQGKAQTSKTFNSTGRNLFKNPSSNTKTTESKSENPSKNSNTTQSPLNRKKPLNNQKVREKLVRRSKILEKIESSRPHPSILINSRSPAVFIQGNKQEMKEKQSRPTPIRNFSNIPSMSSSFSINPSVEPVSDYNEESDDLSSKPRVSLVIPKFSSIQSFSRPASRSSAYSCSKQSLDMSFSEENKENLNQLQSEFKSLEDQFKSRLDSEQQQLYIDLREKQEKLKQVTLSNLSKSTQCDLAGLTQNDLLNRMRCKEKYRQLLEGIFENPQDINFLPSKGRRELAASVKGHNPQKCEKICEHLKRALKTVRKFKAKLYPLKLVKL